MLFSRSETSGMLQKSVSDVCSSTTVASCFAPSPVMPLKLTLCGMNTEHKCQRVLTVGRRCAAAYLSSVRALFFFRPLERCFAPFAPRPFDSKLPGRVESKRQGVLTPSQKRAHETHLMDCNEVFTLSISVSAMMPSAV